MLSLQRLALAATTLCLSLLGMFLAKLYQQRRRMKDLVSHRDDFLAPELT